MHLEGPRTPGKSSAAGAAAGGKADDDWEMSATGVLRKVKRTTVYEPSFDLSQLPSPIGAESLQSEFSRITLEHEPEATEVEILYWDSPDNCLPKFITRVPLISKCSLFTYYEQYSKR